MYHAMVRKNPTLLAIVLFLVIFAIIQWIQPSWLYEKDGSIRSFGIGYRNKTIFPIWLFSIVLGILCYVAVMYYIVYPRLMWQ